MKRALTLVVALGLGAAASAADPETKPAAKDASKPAAQPAAAPQVTEAAQDSPLVAAAKRANRKGRKGTNVITNETLAKTGAGAHITTTTVQRPFVAPKAYEPPAPTPEMVAIQAREAEKRRAAEEAAVRKKAEEAQKRAAAAAAAGAEEGMYHDADLDPAEAERAQEDANRKPPQR